MATDNQVRWADSLPMPRAADSRWRVLSARLTTNTMPAGVEKELRVTRYLPGKQAHKQTPHNTFIADSNRGSNLFHPLAVSRFLRIVLRCG